MTRKRALFLINSLEGGGAERVMSTLLRHSEAERDEFDIVLGLLDNEPAAYTVPDWVDVRQFDCRKSLLRSLSVVQRLVADVRPHVTMSFLTRSNMANVLSARAPCVISERANTSAHFPSGLRGMLPRAMVRAIYPRATRVIAVSEGVADDLRETFGVAPDRLIAIPNPVDVDAIVARATEPSPIAIEGPYILAAGRLTKSKNFAMLIRAYAAAQCPQRLVIIGEGAERDALLSIANECDVADRVVMPGFAANPYALMRNADMFVLSSNAEGFPNGLVEAMAVGAPVIATNCRSGPSEILAEMSRDQIEGVTFAKHGVLTPTDSVDAMAEALNAMCDPERRRAYGEKAALRARAYDAVVAKDRYWAVLREAMSKAR